MASIDGVASRSDPVPTRVTAADRIVVRPDRIAAPAEPPSHGRADRFRIPVRPLARGLEIGSRATSGPLDCGVLNRFDRVSIRVNDPLHAVLRLDQLPA